MRTFGRFITEGGVSTFQHAENPSNDNAGEKKKKKKKKNKKKGTNAEENQQEGDELGVD